MQAFKKENHIVNDKNENKNFISIYIVILK